MKYIDADKIRTEIKRLKAENNCGTDEFIAAKDIAYDKVFDFLETLDEPVTDCHDLKEAAENPYVLNDVSHAAFEYERTRNDLDARSDNEVVRRAFIAGAEWQKKQIPMPEDTVIFNKGVEEGKRLMMEGAVEGEVYKFGEIAYVKEHNNVELTKYLSQFNNGDKVKIIVVHETDIR